MTWLGGHPVQLGACQVWRVPVGAEWRCAEAHWRLLDAHEHAQAARYRFEADRARFVVARSTLRQLLGRRLGLPGRDIAFTAGAHGKPLLAPDCGSLHFNTSHSGDWVLHALDATSPVGVDVEAVEPALGHLEDFESVLSPEEASMLHRLPEALRARAMASVWVRKEAYVKALGDGLGRALQRISIGADHTGRLYLRHDRNPGGAGARWQFEDVPVDDRHVACVVHRHEEATRSAPPSR